MKWIDLFKLKVFCILLLVAIVASGVLNCFEIRAEAAVSGNDLRKPIEGEWDRIYFGNYYQNDSVQKTPIKWRVLSVNGNDVFLISEKILDCQPYANSSGKVTWEDSHIRQWLNNTFFYEAFSESERGAIIQKEVINDEATGNNTLDYVYLLSSDEIAGEEYGFSWNHGADEANQAKCTEYAKLKGVVVTEGGRETTYWGHSVYTIGNLGGWWLRTGSSSIWSFAYIVEENGTERGYYRNQTGIGVRPVLHMDLSKNLWAYADTTRNIGLLAKNVKVNIKAEKGTVAGYGNKYYGFCRKKILIKKTKAECGCEIWYSTKKKMTKKNSEIKTCGTTRKKAYAVLEKLKKGKTYYVKARAYTNMGDDVYGEWSQTIKVKT